MGDRTQLRSSTFDAMSFRRVIASLLPPTTPMSLSDCPVAKVVYALNGKGVWIDGCRVVQ